jgi:uncharacterized protein (TIGR00251 family)
MAAPSAPELRIAVRLAPRAARDEVVGLRENVLIVRVSAPAVDGQANRALSRVLGDHLGIRPSAITIVRGERSRDKLIAIAGLDRAAFEARVARG